jgi:hypothetical protein
MILTTTSLKATASTRSSDDSKHLNDIDRRAPVNVVRPPSGRRAPYRTHGDSMIISTVLAEKEVQVGLSRDQQTDMTECYVSCAQDLTTHIEPTTALSKAKYQIVSDLRMILN